MADVFHLGLTRDDLAGATVAILPGDPGRVPRIAALLDDDTFLASNREYTSHRGTAGGAPIVVCSTGIGGPSTSIAVEELAQLGVRTFLRVGTTGAIQPDIEVGTIVVTTGAVRLDGASRHFAPLEYPAVADFACTTALGSAARADGVEPRIGITASADTFYPARSATTRCRATSHATSRAAWPSGRPSACCNYEMESATLFTMCSANGFRAGCVAGVIVNRHTQEIPDESVIAEVEQRSVRIVVDAAARLAGDAPGE